MPLEALRARLDDIKGRYKLCVRHLEDLGASDGESDTSDNTPDDTSQSARTDRPKPAQRPRRTNAGRNMAYSPQPIEDGTRPPPRVRRAGPGVAMARDRSPTGASPAKAARKAAGGADLGQEEGPFMCPWPGCNKSFERIKSRSAHLKWHGAWQVTLMMSRITHVQGATTPRAASPSTRASLPWSTCLMKRTMTTTWTPTTPTCMAPEHLHGPTA